MRRLTAMLAICDQDALRLLRANLRAGGYEVLTVHSAREILEQTEEVIADLLVVGEVLPDMEGLSLCRKLRESSNIPVVMMGREEGSAGVVAALNSGADDFLSYPYSTDEFFARVNAVMRRASREVNIKGRTAALTPTEFKLLMYLADRPDQVIPHEELLVNIWGKEYAQCVHYLRVGIGRLRQKIEKDPANPVYLVTCSGVGYMLQEGGSAGS